MIVECNSKTLPQERYNAEWIAEKGYGIVVDSFRDIAAAVQKLIEKSTFEDFRRRTSTYENRALFDVDRILDTCYERAHSSEEMANTRA